MTTKKIVRRKKPAPVAKDPSPEPKKRGRGEYRTIAWLGRPGESATCSCGNVAVELVDSDAVIRATGGWVQQGQWIACGSSAANSRGCRDRIRLSPRLVWEDPNGRAYTMGMFLSGEDTSRRVR